MLKLVSSVVSSVLFDQLLFYAFIPLVFTLIILLPFRVFR